jgi:chromosome partitioning protein
MRRIAVMNQKGGVGKTTTTINLAHALALAGHRVTALDLDPQGQLGAGLGVVANGHGGMDEVLLAQAPLRAVLQPAREHLRVAPAGPRLSEFEFMSEGGARRGMFLKEALQAGQGDEDEIVLIDAPPSAGLLAMNVLMAVDEVLIPVTGEYLALHGVGRFMRILQHIDESLERKTKLWIALTRFNERRRMARAVREKLLEYFPGTLLATPIRESAAVADSPGVALSIFEYQRRGNGADDYRALADDLLNARTVQ